MNRLLIFCMAICMLSAVNCRTAKTKEKDKTAFRKIRVDKTKTIQALTDSLTAAGVTELLYVNYSCEKCAADLALDRKSPGENYQAAQLSEPVYFFWRSGTDYYFKKIDQFGIYATVNRGRFYDFMLFDFFTRNEKELQSERIAFELNDIYPGIKPQKANDSIRYKEVDYAIYPGLPEGADNLYRPENNENNTAKLVYRANGKVFEKLLELYKFRPVTSPDPAPGEVKGHRPFANTTATYYRNQSLRVYQWLKLIEGQLWELEAKNRW